MRTDKFKTLLFQFILIFFLIFVLLVLSKISLSKFALTLSIFTVIMLFFFKKRQIKSIYKNEVLIVMTIAAFLYLIVFYGMGLYFGFARSSVFPNFNGFRYFIIPTLLVIISTEYIREMFLACRYKVNIFKFNIDFVSLFTLVIGVLIDLILYSRLYNLGNFSEFLLVVGFIFFASISNNLLFNYLCNRYDIKAIIVYRVFTTMYMYFLPIVPNIYIFFRSFLRMLYPYIIYLYIEKEFNQIEYVVSSDLKKRQSFQIAGLLALSLVVVVLVSGKFVLGLVVIGSNSMTGTINMGDAVLYIQTKDIDVGEVCIFNHDDYRLIHRVIDKKSVNDKVRLLTKGDANNTEDNFFVYDEDVIGKVVFRIKYLGWPSIWLRDLFSSK